MNLLLATDKFKGTATAREVCAALAAGLLAARPGAQVRQLPLADGGDGTLAVLADHLPLATTPVATRDPLGRPLTATYARHGAHAYIELASASGHALLTPGERNPLRTSTYGTGLLLADALARGCTRVTLLLGGSATHDLGLGIAAALGVVFLDAQGKTFVPTGGTLGEVDAITLPQNPPWRGAAVALWCDVSNTLLGPRGAARVYAAQKGASPGDIERLEEGGRQVLRKLEALTGQSLGALAGGGAAGGIAIGLTGLLGATLQPGFPAIRALSGLDEDIAWADHVVTGEGQLDAASFEGKVVGHVAEACARAGKPCSIVVGRSALTELPAPGGSPLAVHELVDFARSEAEALTAAGAVLTRLGAWLGARLG